MLIETPLDHQAVTSTSHDPRPCLLSHRFLFLCSTFNDKTNYLPKLQEDVSDKKITTEKYVSALAFTDSSLLRKITIYFVSITGQQGHVIFLLCFAF